VSTNFVMLGRASPLSAKIYDESKPLRAAIHLIENRQDPEWPARLTTNSHRSGLGRGFSRDIFDHHFRAVKPQPFTTTRSIRNVHESENVLSLARISEGHNKTGIRKGWRGGLRVDFHVVRGGRRSPLRKTLKDAKAQRNVGPLEAGSLDSRIFHPCVAVCFVRRRMKSASPISQRSRRLWCDENAAEYSPISSHTAYYAVVTCQICRQVRPTDVSRYDMPWIRLLRIFMRTTVRKGHASATLSQVSQGIIFKIIRPAACSIQNQQTSITVRQLNRSM
jgi:hypothetical protein